MNQACAILAGTDENERQAPKSKELPAPQDVYNEFSPASFWNHSTSVLLTELAM
jgi:hypothetical protein